MADTIETGLLPRTYFKAPRVPFDFRALAIAMLGYLVYWGGSLLLNEIFGVDHLVGSFLAQACLIFEQIPFIGGVIPLVLGEVFVGESLTRAVNLDDYTFWHQLVGGVWLFAVWSFFGQAIHRITSLRIARDEGLSFGEAFAFGTTNWLTVILAPVIITLTIAFFYGCNALAGLVISIPYVGQLLSLILIPLALISSLLILLIAVGGIFGLPLIGAAAAWERNGSLDAISRAFSYIFARPLQFFWNYFLIFLFLGVVLLVGSWFVTVLTKSVDAGILSSNLSMVVDPPPVGGEDWDDLTTEQAADYKELAAGSSTGYRDGRDRNDSPFAKHWDAVPVGGLKDGLSVIAFWVAINLIWLGILGYAIYWFLGASTSVYADLRADVDGTEEDEIYIEEEEEDFEALAEAVGAAEAESAADAGEPAGEKADAPPSESPPEKAEGDDEPKAEGEAEKPESGGDA